MTNKATLEALGNAWSAYLESTNYQTTPNDEDDMNDFRRAIHEAQSIVAARELQLVNPEFFK